MKVYDIISKDNRTSQDYYTKIGTFPLQPNEQSNYNFPLNNINIILEVFWNGNGGYGEFCRFNVALRNSTSLLINTLTTLVKGKIVENPIAYVRTDNGFDLYVRANTLISTNLNVKCNIISSKDCRFIRESGNPFIDISNLNATYYNPDKLKIENCDIKNISNNNRFFGTPSDSSTSIEIPNYQSGKRYVIKIKNFNADSVKAVDVFIYNNSSMKYKFPYDDSTLIPSFSNGTITLSGLIYYSQIYYEIVMF